MDRGNVAGGSAGSCLGMVAVALVPTGVILASYHLIHRRLESNLKLDSAITDQQRRQSRTKTKKKVRFADDVAAHVDTSADGEDFRRLRRAPDGGQLIRPALRKA